ncbi:MAG: hypothetical protein H7210_11580, partial [Pyrinomonadaceae bacterium]|nr:hypothetical protein [Phycisphaerales bacterium]
SGSFRKVSGTGSIDGKHIKWSYWREWWNGNQLENSFGGKAWLDKP